MMMKVLINYMTNSKILTNKINYYKMEGVKNKFNFREFLNKLLMIKILK